VPLPLPLVKKLVVTVPAGGEGRRATVTVAVSNTDRPGRRWAAWRVAESRMAVAVVVLPG